MSRKNTFVYNPSTIDISRSKIPFSHRHLTAILHGKCVPIEITEVIPGDSMKYKLNALVRMSTPIAPIMDNIYMNVAAFFVPKRLIWDKTKEFYGENRTGYGVQTEIEEPYCKDPAGSIIPGGQTMQTLAEYLGVVRQNVGTISDYTPISLNPFRAYLQVINDWFINENLQAPYLWNHNSTGNYGPQIATRYGSDVFPSSNTSVFTVCKKLDRFTSCLPWAQKSNSAVLLPLGSTAPVDFFSGSVEAELGVVGAQGGLIAHDGTNPLPNGAQVEAKVDLSQASAATVNQFRMAVATQRYLEKLARTGSKYREYIKGMFGVNIGDTTAQMAEYLGGVSFPINISQVLSTSGYAAGVSSTVGAPGANSVTGKSDYLFTKSFVEPGYLVIVAYTKHDRTYGQGLDEIFSKKEIWDYYTPSFANIGEQAIKKSRLYFNGLASSDALEFGFQEAWSEYRSKRDMITSIVAPSNSTQLNYWSLAENFAAAPSLNETFITEDRAAIARCLTTGLTGPDFICDFFFEATAVRPMPVYSIPGLVDHN